MKIVTWQDVVDARSNYLAEARLNRSVPSVQLKELVEEYNKNSDVVQVLNVKLHGEEHHLALIVASYLDDERKKALFSDLFFWTTVMKPASSSANEIIKSLPKEWVMFRLKNEIEKYLGPNATYEEYRMTIQFADGYAPEIARDIVQRALVHSDDYVKEVGEEFKYLLGDN